MVVSNLMKMPRVLCSGLLVAGLIALFVAQRVLSDGTAQTLFLLAGGLGILSSIVLRVGQWFYETGASRKVHGYLLASSLGVLVALLVYFSRTDTGLSLFGLTGTARERLEGSMTALWPAIMTVSLGAQLFMEFVYARMPIREAIEIRRVRAAAKAGLTLSLSAVFLFAVNYVASQREVKRDLSYFRTSAPSEGTLGMVKRLSGDPVRVILFYPKVSDVLQQLTPYFETVDKASDRLSVQIKDYALAPDLVKEHRIRSNGIVLLLQGEQGSAKAQSFEVGEDLEGARGKLRKLDEHFQQNLTALTRPPRSLHLTTGHREFSPTGQDGDPPGARIQHLKSLLDRFNIKTHDLGLAQGLASDIPQDARAVAVFGPRERFLEEEAQSLLRYVERGGRVLVTVDSDIDTGLEPLFQGLGVKIETGILNDPAKPMKRTFTEADHEIVFTNDYSSHPTVTTASGHAQEAATVFLRGGAVNRLDTPSSKDGSKRSVIFPMRSGPQSFLDLNDNHIQDGSEVNKSYNMMAAISVSRDNGEEGRVVLIANGDFATDQLMRVPGNMLILIDSLRWLIGEEEIAASLTSEEDIPIEHTRDEDKIWFYVTAFGVPLPFLALGVWLAARRRKRSEGRS